MNAKQLQKLKRALESRRRDLARVLSPAALNPEDLDHGRDEGDRANTALSKEIVLLLNAQDQKLFAEVESALVRIANGTFGDCLNCDQEIPAKRLEALPWTPYCITCQELIEEQGAL